jgi:hypothetical protein
MKKASSLVLLAAVLLLANAGAAFAATHYVDQNSTNATPPYTDWSTAATNIQDAVDAAALGDEIVVTDGTYDSGGRDGNRVKVDKPLTLRSANGPQFSTITGGGTNRCAYLTNDASLSGFTLSNGYGGVLCESVSAVVSHCVLTGNQGGAGGFGFAGGGAFGGTLNNCTLSGNTVEGSIEAGSGGGAANCTLNNCTLIGNSTSGYYSLIDPIYVGLGGGAYACTLNNCTLRANGAGGAAYGCTLNNCALIANSGGAANCTLNNCTLTGNSGGASGCTLTNCIVYFNTGLNYDTSCNLNYCCTTPLPTNGVGNISSDPQLASASHLSALSPCIGKGNYAAVSGTDIDGEPWANPPSVGCDEFHAGTVAGPLSGAVAASYTNVAAGYPVDFAALIEGRTDLSVWAFGDGAVETNQPYTAHSWAAPGDYSVTLWAFNDSYPGGISATFTVHVRTGLHYVAANCADPVAPYTSWATAATTIQDAIEAAEPGAQVVVTNGTYARITAGTPPGLTGPFSPPPAPVRPLSVRSVNGALFTIIDGGHSNSCASLGNDVSLSGFTLTNGFGGNAGGVAGGTLNDCILSGNSAWSGGGASGSTLNNCALIGNSARGYSYYYGYYECHSCDYNEGGVCCGYVYFYGYDPGYGGGADACTLNNCTLAGNSSADYGGGAANCRLNNCIVCFNTAPQGTNYADCTLSYCCTTPLPTNGLGNITSAALFVDTNGWANLHLQSNSPCINAGNNALAVANTDLDGNPRISGGIVDMGAYEFQFFPPVAIASVSPLFGILPGDTNLFILSPNNLAAAVVLDGSQSSDPYDIPLQFFWYVDEQTNLLATAAVASSVLPVGPHTVKLAVSDGYDVGTAQVSFEIITPAGAVGQLAQLVNDAELESHNQQPLLATLQAGMASFQRGEIATALNQLSAFQNKVHAQVAPSNPLLASELIAASKMISDVAVER